MTYNEGQFQLFLARAAYWTALVTSGAYKTRKLQRGTDAKTAYGRIVFCDCTDEEKLEDTLATAQRHIQMASDFAETFPDAEKPMVGSVNPDGWGPMSDGA